MDEPIPNQPNTSSQTETVTPSLPPIPPAPVASTPPPTPLPQTQPKQPDNKLRIIGALLFLGIIVSGFLYVKSSRRPAEEVLVPPTPTVTPSPTPPPKVSRIATTAAFASFSEEIASLSGVISSFTLQDSTLAPPIMDLDLGL